MKNVALKLITDTKEEKTSGRSFEMVDASDSDAELHALRNIVSDLAEYLQRLPGHDIAREELILRARLLRWMPGVPLTPARG